jgi:cell division protein FtsQ
LGWFKRRGWIIGLVLAILATLAWTNRFYLQRFNPMELRHLQYIDIEGNRMLTWEDVVQNAQVEPGMLLSEVFEDSVEKNLMQLPLIHKVTVEKHFPSSLTIKVQESSPVVAYFQGSHATVYSERGLLLPMSTSTAFHLPVVDSMAFERIADVASHLQKLKQENAELYGLVSQVSWSDEHRAYEVFFSDVGYKVLFPEREWDSNLWTLYESVKRGFPQDMNCAGEVDLRFAGFLYIRNFDKRCVNG